jgi:hypothetical protein
MLRGHSGFILQSRLDRQTDGGILFGEYEPLAQSGLFDSDFYIKSNPDLATLNIDPLLHYLERGCRERRDPSARFDTGHYVKLCDALQAVALRRAMACSPCFLERPEDCPRGITCLSDLAVADVYQACRQALARVGLS